jgi:MFS transporter, MHS family, proline/betaine transporter
MMPTFVTLASPTVGDIPERLAIFTAVAAVVYLVGALLSRETRGRVAAEETGAGAPSAASTATTGSALPR